MKWFFIAVFAALSLAAQAQERPNILLITVDDLNDWVGCLGGHPQSKTPNFDRLAERGILFTNAHCNAPICGPSRTSLMTGLRPSTTGCYDNSHNFRNSTFNDPAQLLPRYFAAKGYEVVGCGKLFHGSDGQEFFQRYGPALGQGPLPKERFHVTNDASRTKLWDWGAFPEKTEDTHDFKSAEFAVGELQSEHDKPLFLGVGFYRPHVPMYAPEEFFQDFPIGEVELPAILKTDLDDVPPSALELVQHGSVAPPHTWFVEKDKWHSAVQAYLASVALMDHCLGKVMDALDSGPQADNTWIFLTGDHGWHLGEKEVWAKRTLWERSTRVPMMIIPPKQLAEQFAVGKSCEAPVEMLSFYPTMVEVSGIDPNPTVEGVSLVPLLKDVSADWKHPAITTHLKDNHTVRTAHWRYSRYADGAEELFDHRADTNEWKNLASDPQHKDKLTDLARFLPQVNAEPVKSGGKGKKQRPAKAKK